MATFACAAGPAYGPLGWAEALSPRGPGLWFPLGCGSSFGVRVCDKLVGGEYSTCVQVWSRGSCHFWGDTPHYPQGYIESHPPCFIDISAMLLGNMADMSLPRGRGRKARKGVRGQVLDSSRSLGMTGLRGVGWGREGGGVTVGKRPRRIDNAGPPQLDPSTVLRVSGPSWE